MLHRQPRPVRLMTTFGHVEIEAVYGYDQRQKRWRCPLREALELEPRQVMTPELIERLCYTATQALSYEATARLAAMWGVSIDPSTVWRHVQAQGAACRQQAEAQTDRALEPSTRGEVIAQARRDHGCQRFSLVIMMDAWKIRERGEQWGLKPPDLPAERVAWRDEKTAIAFRLEDRGATASGRPIITRKSYEAMRGDPHEFGRRVYAMALREGLTQAQRVYVVADGGVWIWNIAKERFREATHVLDFYHASENLWTVARALHADGQQARQWVEPLLHQLRHGGEAGVLETLEDFDEVIETLDDEAGQSVRRGAEYFQTHRERLHYSQVHEQGCPIGSGAMESTCSQLQDRFKRTGQFWILTGHSNLMALELARRNEQWDRLWSRSS